jgi:hypothetical protein
VMAGSATPGYLLVRLQPLAGTYTHRPQTSYVLVGEASITQHASHGRDLALRF